MQNKAFQNGFLLQGTGFRFARDFWSVLSSIGRLGLSGYAHSWNGHNHHQRWDVFQVLVEKQFGRHTQRRGLKVKEMWSNGVEKKKSLRLSNVNNKRVNKSAVLKANDRVMAKDRNYDGLWSEWRKETFRKASRRQVACGSRNLLSIAWNSRGWDLKSHKSDYFVATN